MGSGHIVYGTNTYPSSTLKPSFPGWGGMGVLYLVLILILVLAKKQVSPDWVWCLVLKTILAVPEKTNFPVLGERWWSNRVLW